MPFVVDESKLSAAAHRCQQPGDAGFIIDAALQIGGANLVREPQRFPGGEFQQCAVHMQGFAAVCTRSHILQQLTLHKAGTDAAAIIDLLHFVRRDKTFPDLFWCCANIEFVL
ncbi:hypothetical protein D3C81_1739190 [compost metagenome]